jgi:hypothetical protein
MTDTGSKFVVHANDLAFCSLASLCSIYDSIHSSDDHTKMEVGKVLSLDVEYDSSHLSPVGASMTVDFGTITSKYSIGPNLCNELMRKRISVDDVVRLDFENSTIDRVRETTLMEDCKVPPPQITIVGFDEIEDDFMKEFTWQQYAWSKATRESPPFTNINIHEIMTQVNLD